MEDDLENKNENKVAVVNFRTSQRKKDEFAESAEKLGVSVSEYFHLLHCFYSSDLNSLSKQNKNNK